jgi:hypothetical protein
MACDHAKRLPSPDVLSAPVRDAAERGLLGEGHGVVVPYACSMGIRSDEGVLITGVYGAGKSTVAAEISYLLEQRRQPYALLDLDFLGWGVNSFDDRAAQNPFMLRNLAAVVSNYREGGISVFVLAYFVSSHEELHGIREAVGVPLRVVRLSVPLPDIEQRLAADVTTERREELREAARQIAAGEGVGVEDVVLANDRPVPIVAKQIMTWLGWV